MKRAGGRGREWMGWEERRGEEDGGGAGKEALPVTDSNAFRNARRQSDNGTRNAKRVQMDIE